MNTQKINLLKQLIKRDVTSRYKGSYLGIIWSFIIPLLMLLVYTFVFSVVFEGRWNVESTNKVEFALIIFSGITVFNFFSEVLNRSSSIIISNTNYVKKVIFPLEILPISITISALVHALISILILFIGLIVFMGGISLTALFLPLVLLPVILLSLGISWFLASIGTYIRDVGYIINVLTGALMFLSPIFYPVSSVPDSLKFVYYLNPLSYTVEDMRKILLWNQYPDFWWLLIGSLVGLVVALLGYFWFQKTRRGFSDVL